jgi:copper(I)-binding protein
MIILRAFIISAFLTMIPVAAYAEKLAISVGNAYAFAVPKDANIAAAFMALTYPAGTENVPDRILRVETPVAEKAEMHTMSIENNVMTMRPVDSFPLPPTGSFILKPQGAHIMLTGLKQPLTAGGKFPLTLVFEKSGPVTTEVSIRAPGDIPDSEATDEPPEEKAVHQDMMMDMDHSHHDMKP